MLGKSRAVIRQFGTAERSGNRRGLKMKSDLLRFTRIYSVRPIWELRLWWEPLRTGANWA